MLRRAWIVSGALVLLAACHGDTEVMRGAARPDAADTFVVLDAGDLGRDAGADAAVGNLGAAERLAINEVLYDFASPTSGDDAGQELVEIAGAPGTPLDGVVVSIVDATGAVLTEVALPDVPMPDTGLFVLGADAGRGTLVVGADQVAAFSLPDAAGALQLVGSSGLLDVVAWGDVPAGLRDATRGLRIVEGTPCAAPPVLSYPGELARDEESLDTDDNARDFHADPTPSPGASNAPPRLTVTESAPKDALLGAPATIVLRGMDFSDGLVVHVGDAVAGPCVATAVDVATCPVTGRGATPARVDIRVQARDAASEVVLAGAFTWTTANNDGGGAVECDYCVLQYPESLSTTTGVAAGPVFARIFEGGKTDTTRGSAAGDVLAQIGVGPEGTNPATSNAWTWTAATFNVEAGTGRNDDEYQGMVTAPAAGSYLYTMRFSLDGGLSFSYVDLNGAGSNSGLGFNALDLGSLTVR